MTEPTTPRRRWLRYSLRTLFVVLTIFCVWLGVQVKWIRDRNAARQWITEHGNYSNLDDNPMNAQIWRAGAPWQIRLFDEATHIIDLTDESAQDMERVRELERLFPEARIYEQTPAFSRTLGGWRTGHYSTAQPRVP